MKNQAAQRCVSKVGRFDGHIFVTGEYNHGVRVFAQRLAGIAARDGFPCTAGLSGFFALSRGAEIALPCPRNQR